MPDDHPRATRAIKRPLVDWQGLLRSAPLFALIAIAAGLSYRYHLLLLAQRDAVEHTYEVITTLETTLVRIIDAETGQRGFVITGDGAYLLPYQRALAEIPPLLSRLRGLVDDSIAQQERVVTLDRRLANKLAELQETLVARQQSGLDAARAVVMRDQGRIEMDAVRDVIGEMRGAEAALLAQRSAEARATERRLLWVTLACGLLSLLARVGIALLWKPSPRKESTC